MSCSAFLLNFAIDDVLRRLVESLLDDGVELLPRLRLRDFEYTYDIVLLASNVVIAQLFNRLMT